MPKAQTADTILKFWFEDITPEQWFKKDTDFDSTIRDRFGPTIEAALSARLDNWANTAELPCADHRAGPIYA